MEKGTKTTPKAPKAAKGKLIDIGGKEDPARYVHPDHVTGIAVDGNLTTVHLSGGSIVQTSRPVAEVREALGY